MHKLSTLIQNNEKEINEGFKLGKNAVKTNHQYSVIPTDKKELNEILKERLAKDKDADLNDIDVSNITDMSNIFKWLDPHNINISDWDVSRATNMNHMFFGCKNMNFESLENWDVSNVEDMSYMFTGTNITGKEIENWDVSNVENMSSMFEYCTNFNCDLSKWNVSKVKYATTMFSDCNNFTGQSLEKWNIKSVTLARGMFRDCYKFNIDVSAWDVSNITDFSEMFKSCSLFEGIGLDKWKLDSAKRIDSMFYDCHKLSVKLNRWKITSLVSKNRYVFKDCENMKGKIPLWFYK